MFFILTRSLVKSFPTTNLLESVHAAILITTDIIENLSSSR